MNEALVAPAPMTEAELGLAHLCYRSICDSKRQVANLRINVAMKEER